MRRRLQEVDGKLVDVEKIISPQRVIVVDYGKQNSVDSGIVVETYVEV